MKRVNIYRLRILPIAPSREDAVERKENAEGNYKTATLTPQAWEKRIADKRQEDLNMAIYRKTGSTSQLSPLFVAEMMGFPPDYTVSPFLDGAKNPSKPTATPSCPRLPIASSG